MLRILQKGVPTTRGAQAYEAPRAVGDLTQGRLVCEVANPSYSDHLGFTLPSGSGPIIGVVDKNHADIDHYRLRQTAVPSDSAPYGTTEIVAPEVIKDGEDCFVWTNGGVYHTDQISTASGTFSVGDRLTALRTAGDDCGKLIKLADGGTGQWVGTVQGYDSTSGTLKWASVL